MQGKAVSDVVAYLTFLQNEGYPVRVELTEATFENCKEALAPFAPAEKSDGGLPITYDGMEIARAYLAGQQEKLATLLLPLNCLFEKMYESCGEHASEEEEKDAYRKSLLLIKEHYMEGITVTELAEQVGYSGSYFGYIFKKKHGIPVNQYVRELQLAKAQELLLNTSFSVAMVAEYVGYEDANYFSSLFKKQFGLSPKQYRKENHRVV